MKNYFIVCIMFISMLSCKASYGPGNIEDDKKIIETEIQKFHESFNSNNFEKIISNSHSTLLANVDRNDLITSMQNTKNKFGNFTSVSKKWVNIIVKAPVEARAVYNSKFEKSDTTEMYIFLKEHKDFKLVKYEIHEGFIQPPSK